MKRIFYLMTGLACLAFLINSEVNGQWATSGSDIYNTNSGNVGIGTSTPGYLLHVAKSATSPSIRIQNLGGAGGAAFEMIDNLSSADWKFKATASGGFKIRDHASGMDVIQVEKSALANALYIEMGGNVGLGLSNPLEKLHVNGAVLLGTTTGANTGTVRFNGSHFQGRIASGWVDLDMQSKVRAYQVDPATQIILPSVWTPINFTDDSPLSIGWDQLGEFTVAASAAAPVPPEMSYFTASETGYYQVNARASIELPDNPGAVTPFSYVSIAIWTGPAPGATTSFAVGNNLQIGYFGLEGQPYPLAHNNAPNVSDVVYLVAGQILSIWFWQSSLVPLPLVQGSDQVYVSIHRVS